MWLGEYRLGKSWRYILQSLLNLFPFLLQTRLPRPPPPPPPFPNILTIFAGIAGWTDALEECGPDPRRIYCCNVYFLEVRLAVPEEVFYLLSWLFACNLVSPSIYLRHSRTCSEIGAMLGRSGITDADGVELHWESLKNVWANSKLSSILKKIFDFEMDHILFYFLIFYNFAIIFFFLPALLRSSIYNFRCSQQTDQTDLSIMSVCLLNDRKLVCLSQ